MRKLQTNHTVTKFTCSCCANEVPRYGTGQTHCTACAVDRNKDQRTISTLRKTVDKLRTQISKLQNELSRNNKK